jgi:uncharacterized HAD superfamily protein
MDREESVGLRFNDGKLRYDLQHPKAIEGLVEVLTLGSKKYAPRNWEKGMNWTIVIASLKRHLAAIEKGEDYDEETGLLHADHIQCNAHFLSAYYQIAPQFDDRNHQYLKPKKIGLDIDGVLADFVGHLMKISGNEGHIPQHWNDPIIRDEFDKVKHDSSFWLTMPTLIDRSEITFEPHCYITARSIAPAITQEWLDRNKFPKATLYCVNEGESKVEMAKKSGIDIFIDDSFSNFQELNNAGVFTYLYNAKYNKKYNVGHKRIYNLKDLI